MIFTLGDEGEFFVLQKFTAFGKDGLVLAEFHVIIFSPSALVLEISDSDYSIFVSERFAKMMRDVFGSVDRMDMLGYLSRLGGKLKIAKAIFFIDRIEVFDENNWEEIVKIFIYKLEKRVVKRGGIFIFPPIRNLFFILDKMKYRCVPGLNYRFGSKANRGWDFNFEVFCEC